MLFTWDTTNLCIIFHWWHISSTFTLLISLVAIALLTAGYEVVREVSRRYETSSAEYANSLPSKCMSIWIIDTRQGFETLELRLDVSSRRRSCWSRSGLISLVREGRWATREEDQNGEGGTICGAGVLQLLHYVGLLHSNGPVNAHAYICRLLFMTYNGWVMLSVAVGAFFGYLGFGNSSPTKSVACH